MEEGKNPWQGYFIGLLLFCYLIVGAGAAISIHLNYFNVTKASTLLRNHLFCASFGFTGATIALIRKYYKAWITRSAAILTESNPPFQDWSFGWIYYYIVRPWLGATLGAFVFMLSLIGFNVLQSADKVTMMSEEGKMLLFALAFLTGYSVSDVLDRLSDTSEQLFKKKER